MAPAQPDTIAHALFTLQTLYETYAAPILPPPLNTLVSSLLSSALTIQPYVSGILAQSNALMSSLLTGNADSTSGNGMVSAVLLLVTIYVGFKIMNYVRRTIIGWVLLAVKLLMIMVLIQVVIYVNTYGWEKSVRDAGWIGGILWGFAEQVFEGDNTKNKIPRGMRGRNTGNGRDQAPIGRTGWI